MTSQSTLLIKQYVALIKLESFDRSLKFVEELSEKIISDLDLKVVKKISHIFSPTGITLGYILSQSHLLIHTYPESGIMHIDLVVCNNRSKKEFKNSLKAALSNYIVGFIQVRAVDLDKLQKSFTAKQG